MGSIKLIRIAGIRIDVNASWFFMLFLLIFWISGDFKSALHSSSNTAYVTTVITALLFFGSVIMHELGHAFAARREGIQVQRISLFLLGGTTYMSRDSQTPGEEFRVAAAGPAGTLLFIAIVLGVDLALVGPHRLWHAIKLDGSVRITPVLLALSWLLFMNVIIFIFNLVPAYPLDGGRIARSIVWRITGDKLRGTRTAARLGEGFAFLLGGAGVFVMLEATTFTGLWLILLAFFTWQSARLALNSTAAASRVQGVRVADVMDHEPIVVYGTSTALDALDKVFRLYQSEWLPVVDLDSHFIGIARRQQAEELVSSGHGSQTVGSMLEPDTGRVSILEDQPLTDVLTLESLSRLGAIVVTNDTGLLTGLVTIDQVRRVLQTVLAEPSPS